MGARPSKPTDEQCAELEAVKGEAIEGAAAAILESDALILMTGAGWSADSGLAVYADVANVQAYHDRGLTYHDLCNPAWLESEPELFHGFWGKCFNDYRDVMPHEGYSIVARWRDALAASSRGMRSGKRLHASSGAPGAFFCYTSNVDAHSRRYFSPLEVRECHGNSETWQCASRHCRGAAGMPPPERQADSELEFADFGSASPAPDGRPEPTRWPAPPDFRFAVEAESALAPLGTPERAASVAQPLAPAELSQATSGPGSDDATPEAIAHAFDSNWPRCLHCGGKARPSILMFNDSQWHDDEAQAERWEAWRSSLEDLAQIHGPSFRVTIIEAGAGGNVTTVRNLSEDFRYDRRYIARHATCYATNYVTPHGMPHVVGA